MKFVIALSLILLVPIMGLAQDKKKKKRKALSRKELKVIAKEDILSLRNGILLVRLQTKNKSIQALRKAGKDDLADKIKNRQAKYNLTIVNAFRSGFGFCPSFFFFSNQSRNIRAGNLEVVEFLNDDLQYDPTISIGDKEFFTAEFTTIEEDTAKHQDTYSPMTSENDDEHQVPYSGGSNMGFGALIIKTDQFVQLRRPFPFYTRTYDSLPTKRAPAEVVRKMNLKLNDYLIKSQ